MVDKTPVEMVNRGEVHWHNQEIEGNPEQRSAVERILNKSSGSWPFVVFGPPGTGKTTTLCEAVYQLVSRNIKVAVCAPSNNAAHVFARKLRPYVDSGVLLRLCGTNLEIPEDMREYSARRGDHNMAQLESFTVLVTTIMTLGGLVQAGIEKGHFGYIVIDEAGQATELETLVCLAGIAGPETHIILGGDPQQLGPRLLSETASNNGYGMSLLERLMKSPGYMKADKQYEPRTVIELVKNFRSHWTILQHVSEKFYAGKLQFVAPEAVVNRCLNQPHFQPGMASHFLGVLGQMEKFEAAGSGVSFKNEAEAEVVKDLVTTCLDQGFVADDIGVITPYRGQVITLGKLLPAGVESGTVESFQGREKTIVIISSVRSTPSCCLPDGRRRVGFLANKKRFVVMMTRARALQIVVGNPHELATCPVWRQYLAWLTERNCYRGSSYSMGFNLESAKGLLGEDAVRQLETDDWKVAVEEKEEKTDDL